MKFCSTALAFLTVVESGFASPRVSPHTRQREQPGPLPTSFSVSARLRPYKELRKRQTTSGPTTCGYDNGDPTKPRTADAGFACRVDTTHGLWGFCPVTVIAATDCGLAGHCIDNSGCSGGCGILGETTLTTFSCTNAGSDFCSTALLIDGPDLTFSYIACAPNAGTEKLYANPTFTSAAASTTQSSSSKVVATTVPRTSSSAPVSSFTSSSLGSLQLSSSTTSSTQSAASASTSNTSNSNSSSQNNIGIIVGGVLGGLALIGLFILAALFLLRKYRRNHVRSGMVFPPPTYESQRDDPKSVAGGNMGHNAFNSCGPSELSTKQEPMELAT